MPKEEENNNNNNCVFITIDISTLTRFGLRRLVLDLVGNVVWFCGRVENFGMETLKKPPMSDRERRENMGEGKEIKKNKKNLSKLMCSWILEKILYFVVAKRRQFIVPYFSVA